MGLLFVVFFFSKQESISHLNLKGGKCHRRPITSTNNTDELETFLLFPHLKNRGIEIQKPMHFVNSDHPFRKIVSLALRVTMAQLVWLSG